MYIHLSLCFFSKTVFSSPNEHLGSIRVNQTELKITPIYPCVYHDSKQNETQLVQNETKTLIRFVKFFNSSFTLKTFKI